MVLMDFHRLVVEALRVEGEHQHKEMGQLSDELLLALHNVFGQAFEQSLDLIDRRKVSLVTSRSGRQVFTVSGSKPQPYVCSLAEKFCSCPAFAHHVPGEERVHDVQTLAGVHDGDHGR